MVAKLLIGAALLAAAVPAHAEDWDFVLVNKTGKTIKTIETSDSGKALWAKEQLEDDRVNDPVRAGVSHTVRFDKTTCSVDVRVTFSDDTQAVFTGFNTCNNPIGEFGFKGGIPYAKGV